MARLLLILIVISIALTSLLVYQYSRQFPAFDPVAREGYAPVDTTVTFEWVEYEAPSGRFKVQLPVVPQHANESVTNPRTKVVRNYSMYVAEKPDRTLFIISLITFPNNSPTEDAASLLRSIPNDMMATNQTYQVKQMESGTYKGFPSLDFEIGDDDQTVSGKTFMTGDTLFVLSRIVKNQFDEKSEYDKFINSFQLIE